MNQLKLTVTLSACLLASVPFAVLAEDQGPMTSAGQWFDDVAMATAVKGAILGDAGLKGFDINVIVHQGNVQLSGYVDTQQEAEHAVEVAKSINGVRSVTNSLLIK